MSIAAKSQRKKALAEWKKDAADLEPYDIGGFLYRIIETLEAHETRLNEIDSALEHKGEGSE